MKTNVSRNFLPTYAYVQGVAFPSDTHHRSNNVLGFWLHNDHILEESILHIPDIYNDKKQRMKMMGLPFAKYNLEFGHYYIFALGRRFGQNRLNHERLIHHRIPDEEVRDYYPVDFLKGIENQYTGITTKVVSRYMVYDHHTDFNVFLDQHIVYSSGVGRVSSPPTIYGIPVYFDFTHPDYIDVPKHLYDGKFLLQYHLNDSHVVDSLIRLKKVGNDARSSGDCFTSIYEPHTEHRFNIIVDNLKVLKYQYIAFGETKHYVIIRCNSLDDVNYH